MCRSGAGDPPRKYPVRWRNRSPGRSLAARRPYIPRRAGQPAGLRPKIRRCSAARILFPLKPRAPRPAPRPFAPPPSKTRSTRFSLSLSGIVFSTTASLTRVYLPAFLRETYTARASPSIFRISASSGILRVLLGTGSCTRPGVTSSVAPESGRIYTFTAPRGNSSPVSSTNPGNGSAPARGIDVAATNRRIACREEREPFGCTEIPLFTYYPPINPFSRSHSSATTSGKLPSTSTFLLRFRSVSVSSFFVIGAIRSFICGYSSYAS